MKTPLTITASTWTYCQNACGYCKSGSNHPQWTFSGNFEVYSPPGYENLNELEIRARFGNDYFRRLCPDKSRFLNKWDLLDFDRLIEWILKHCPRCELHISGGEPLLRPDIEDQIEKVIASNINTTIFTNGLLIDQRPRLLSLPLNWVVAHHVPNSFVKWRQNVRMLRKKTYLTTRVLHTKEERDNKNEIGGQYQGLNFVWSRCNGLRERAFEINPADLNCIASGVLHLIVPDGRVFPCNLYGSPIIGHILTGDYWPERARTQDRESRQCVKAGNCAAYQSAVSFP